MIPAIPALAFIRSLPRTVWYGLAGVAAVAAAALLIDKMRDVAYQRGYDDAMLEATAASAAASAAYQRQVDAAASDFSRSVTKVRKTGAGARRAVESEYAGSNGSANRRLVSDDVVRKAQQDRDRILSSGRNGDRDAGE